jgi:hypothetical protein
LGAASAKLDLAESKSVVTKRMLTRSLIIQALSI